MKRSLILTAGILSTVLFQSSEAHAWQTIKALPLQPAQSISINTSMTSYALERLLLCPSVQKELSIPTDKLESLSQWSQKLQAEEQKKLSEAIQDALKNQKTDQIQEISLDLSVDRKKRTLEELKTYLSDAQIQRLLEIQRQMQGFQSFDDPELLASLELTEKQKRELVSIRELLQLELKNQRSSMFARAGTTANVSIAATPAAAASGTVGEAKATAPATATANSDAKTTTTTTTSNGTTTVVTTASPTIAKQGESIQITQSGSVKDFNKQALEDTLDLLTKEQMKVYEQYVGKPFDGKTVQKELMESFRKSAGAGALIIGSP